LFASPLAFPSPKLKFWRGVGERYLQFQFCLWYDVFMTTITKNNVIIPANEYDYLKRIEKTFEQFFSSFSYLKDIEKARKEIKKKQYLSQDVLFKKLGL
jgi:hypothetical protein